MTPAAAVKRDRDPLRFWVMREIALRPRSLAFAALLLLAGCGTTTMPGVTEEADTRAAAIFADCDAQLRAGKLPSYRQAVECARQPVLMTYGRAGYPYMDLVLFDLQERDVGADRADHAEADPAAVRRDIAELERRLEAERERRIAARSFIGGAAPAMPPSQLLAGLDTLREATFPQQNANCFSVGNFTHCN
jgi:hypothetical protein